MSAEDFEKQQAEAESFGGSLIAAKYWQSILKAGFNEAAERMVNVSHWDIMIPAMKIGPDIAGRFLARFDIAGAREARSEAVGGMLAVRNPREKLVLRTARHLAAEFAAGIVPQSTLNHAKGTLTGYLCECVAAGDWKSLQALAKLLKRGDAPEDARGGELSYEGQAWSVFCLLHFNRVTLPTKREIREEMALEDHNRGDFSRWLNALGLGGLPDK